MKFLVISDGGDGCGLAVRLRQEGNEVWIWFKDPQNKRQLDGIIPRVRSVEEGTRKSPDVIVFDMSKMGTMADKLRSQGHLVVGGGEWHDKMELDRAFAMKLMDTFGIGVPNSYAFNNITDAIKFMLTHPKRLVFKPSENKNTSYTYCGATQDDTIAFAAHIMNHIGVDGKCVLQEFVHGTEISTEYWYSNGEPVPMPNGTCETKKMGYDNVGPSTGCATSLVWAYDRKEPRIVQQSLKKMKEFLKRIRYTGPLDINGIVRNGRFYALEFSPRFGYSAIYAYLRLLDEDFGAVLHRVASGDATPFKLKSGFGFALRVSIPPYPYWPEDKTLAKETYHETEGFLIGGVSKEDWQKRVVPLDVASAKAGFVVAGYDGCICECTGYGESPFEAEKEAVDMFKKIQLPNKYARVGDGASIAYDRIQKLYNEGYEIPYFQPKEIRNENVPEKPMSVSGAKVALAGQIGVRPGAIANSAARKYAGTGKAG